MPPIPEFEISDKCVIEMGSATAPNTPVDKSVYFKTLDTDESVGDEDITTMGTVVDGAKILAYLLNEATFDLDVLFDAEFWKHCGDIIRARKKIVLKVYPAGKAVGREMWTATVLVNKRKRKDAVQAVRSGNLTLKRSGPTVEGVMV